MRFFPKDYNFKYLKTTFNCTLNYKFNFIQDESSKGKTWFQKQVLLSGNQGEVQVLYPQVHRLNMSEHYDCLFLIDECDLIPIINHVGINTFNHSPNVFLIISRNIPPQLSVHYKAIYRWIVDNRHYSIERKYKDYDEFVESIRYHCEDSGSGFDYYRYWFQNVTTLNGKDNAPKYLYNNDDTIIADGAAFARTLNILLSMDCKANLFLPDSFEGLVCQNINEGKQIVLNTTSDSILNYKSLEEYYNDKIVELFPNYSKKKCPSYLKKINIIRDYVKSSIYSKVITYIGMEDMDPIAFIKYYSSLVTDNVVESKGFENTNINRAYVAYCMTHNISLE